MSKVVLLSREQSSMASCWNEYLCLDQHAPGAARLSTCQPEWLGSIYDLVPEEDLYDESGELRVPATWDGKEIVGLGDGEYLETAELLEDTESPAFSGETLSIARTYCADNEWDGHPEFADAWRAIEEAVKDSDRPAPRRTG